MWTLGGWNVDPHKANRHISVRKPIMRNIPLPENSEEVDFFMEFLPVDYIKTVLLPKLNERGRNSSGKSNMQYTHEIIYYAFLSI